MQHSSKNFFTLTGGIFLVLLAACGGGGNSISGIDRSGSPATSTAGPISGFGSVIVNGVRYHSDKAIISVSDELGSEKDLHAGLQIYLTGTLNNDGTGDATTIDFFPNVVGPISSINTQLNQLVVLGQTVGITNATIFSSNILPNFIDGLKVGDMIQASGRSNALNMLVATRIDLVNSKPLLILGKVSALDTVNFKFKLNNQVINYASATLKDFNGATLANNLSVFVKGNSLNAQNELVAQTVKMMPPNVRIGSKHAELTGFITRFVSLSDFDVDGVPCSINSNSKYEDGSAKDVALGLQVHVMGDINSKGVLVVSDIRVQPHENAAMAGVVSNVQSNKNGAIVTGSFVLDGVTVTVTNLTRVEDKSYIDLKRFDVGDLHAGDFVKVSGYLSGTKMIATQVERNTMRYNNELRIEGLITNLLSDGFKLNDRQVIIDDQTELRDANGQITDTAGFLAIALNKNVEVRGVLSNEIFKAERVEIKSP